MAKVTAEMAKSAIQKIFPSRTIEWATLCENDWYVFAPDYTDIDEGMINPYFKVNENTGDVSEFYVVKNLSLFKKINAQAASEQKP